MLVAGHTLPAGAQGYWPRDPYTTYDAPPPEFEPQRPRPVRHRAPKRVETPRENAKPQGPIVIAISIDKQQLKIYDANGLFAESPVSTGMRGHSTPMGVFSIIQKNKWHRSNIYSGAPMPYMQRITWSGIAMHAGALPGYPASHGCIRMPVNFATRLWGWTRMGARVIVTPGEISPADFSSARLVSRKPKAAPVAEAAAPEVNKKASNDISATPKADKAVVADATSLPRDAAEKMELRLTTSDKHDEIRAADANGAIPERSDAVVGEAPVASDALKDQTTADDAAKADVKDGPSITAEVKAAAADEVKAADVKTDETKISKSKTSDIKTDKDQARATDTDKTSAPAPTPEAATALAAPVKPRTGHIAAYISRKDSKLYVRQNFEPLFETPVTIAASERPLGTHVFTVRADKNDPETLRWSVVSLPTPTRIARGEDAPRQKNRKNPVAVETIAPLLASTPEEALERITIPDDAMRRLASALATGGSIILSDQGLGNETGRGTDFIVPLR